jgi:hypothetical protein
MAHLTNTSSGQFQKRSRILLTFTAYCWLHTSSSSIYLLLFAPNSSRRDEPITMDEALAIQGPTTPPALVPPVITGIMAITDETSPEDGRHVVHLCAFDAIGPNDTCIRKDAIQHLWNKDKIKDPTESEIDDTVKMLQGLEALVKEEGSRVLKNQVFSLAIARGIGDTANSPSVTKFDELVACFRANPSYELCETMFWVIFTWPIQEMQKKNTEENWFNQKVEDIKTKLKIVYSTIPTQKQAGECFVSRILVKSALTNIRAMFSYSATTASTIGISMRKSSHHPLSHVVNRHLHRHIFQPQNIAGWQSLVEICKTAKKVHEKESRINPPSVQGACDHDAHGHMHTALPPCRLGNNKEFDDHFPSIDPHRVPSGSETFAKQVVADSSYFPASSSNDCKYVHVNSRVSDDISTFRESFAPEVKDPPFENPVATAPLHILYHLPRNISCRVWKNV